MTREARTLLSLLDLPQRCRRCGRASAVPREQVVGRVTITHRTCTACGDSYIIKTAHQGRTLK
jgi:hypothetical protein